MQNYDKTYAAKDHFIGGRVGILSVDLATTDHHHPGTRAIDVHVRVAKLETFNDRGELVSSASAIPSATYRVWLTYTMQGFKIADFKKAVTR